LIVSEKCLFYRDDNVSENEAAVEAICSVCWGQQNVCLLVIWSYGPDRLVFLQCFLVSARFWQILLVPYLVQKRWFRTPLPSSWRCYNQETSHISVVWIFVVLLPCSLLKNGSMSKARWEPDHWSVCAEWCS
jgi:hypothetical protein